MEKNIEQMTPGEQVAFALVHHMVSYNPELVNTLLVQHGEQPSTDPEVNMLRIAKLSGERQEFFNKDFAVTAEKAGYYGTDKAPVFLCKILNREPDLKKFQANFGYFNLFGGGSGTGQATAAGTSAPKPGFFKNIGTKVKGFLQNVFKKKDGNPTVDLDGGPDEKITDLIDKEKKDATPEKLILGMKQWVFYSLLGVLVVLVIVIIIFLARAKKKNKPAEVAAA